MMTNSKRMIGTNHNTVIPYIYLLLSRQTPDRQLC